MENELMSISQFSIATGLSQDCLVLWDKDGVFKPAWKNHNGKRFYSQDQIEIAKSLRYKHNKSKVA